MFYSHHNLYNIFYLLHSKTFSKIKNRKKKRNTDLFGFVQSENSETGNYFSSNALHTHAMEAYFLLFTYPNYLHAIMYSTQYHAHFQWLYQPIMEGITLHPCSIYVVKYTHKHIFKQWFLCQHLQKYIKHTLCIRYKQILTLHYTSIRGNDRL